MISTAKYINTLQQYADNMITIFSLENEKIEETTLECMEKINFEKTCWIRCVTPTVEELTKISGLTTIPESELQESIEEIERPKLKIASYIEIIYTAPYKAKSSTTLPIYFYIYKRVLVTIEKEPLPILAHLEIAFKANHRRSLLKNGPGYFTYFVIDKINDEFTGIIDKMSENLGLFNKQGKAIDEKVYEDVYKASIISSAFNQAIIANIEVLNSLRKLYHRYLNRKDIELYGELYHDALQILDREKIQRDMLTSLVGMQSIIATQRLNKMMKWLTGLALLIMIPTLIASIYGMNFTHIPLAQNPYGFYYLVGFMGLTSLILFVMFRKMEWF